MASRIAIDLSPWHCGDVFEHCLLAIVIMDKLLCERINCNTEYRGNCANGGNGVSPIHYKDEAQATKDAPAGAIVPGQLLERAAFREP